METTIVYWRYILMVYTEKLQLEFRGQLSENLLSALQKIDKK